MEQNTVLYVLINEDHKMKTQWFLSVSIAAMLLLSCENETTPGDLTGEWKYEYKVLKDGTRDYDNPYALLEFNYSDGFILYPDHTGHLMWYDVINSPEKFSWSYNSEQLKISVTNSSGIHIHRYTILMISPDELFFQTPKGFTYLMKRK